MRAGRGIGVSGHDAPPAMLGLHVEAGRTYFVRGRLARYYQERVAVLDLTRINEDEGPTSGVLKVATWFP